MEIRLATYTDLPALRAAYVAFCEEQIARMPIPYPRMDAEEYDNFVVALVRALGRPEFRCWIAQDFGGALLGFIGASIEERAVSKPHRYGYVHWLWVSPAGRGHAIGRALSAVAVEWYVQSGIEMLEIRTLAGDPQWERRGWAPILATHLVSTTAGVIDWIRGVRRPKPEAPLTAPPPVAALPKKRPRRRRATPRMNGADHAR